MPYTDDAMGKGGSARSRRELPAVDDRLVMPALTPERERTIETASADELVALVEALGATGAWPPA